MPDVFISYGHRDAPWVRTLAERLEAESVSVFFDEWDIDLGANIVHRLDEAIRTSRNAIVVYSPTSANSPWVHEEYAALMHESVCRGLLFIPVVYGDAAMPPFAENRMPLDFRNADQDRYDALVRDLVRRLKGLPRERGAPDGARRPIRLPDQARPIVEPDVHSVVLCCADDDAEHGERFLEGLAAGGLPVWSSHDLEPGQDWEWSLRRQIEFAVCLVVMMSPAAQASERVTQMILHAQMHSTVVVPVRLGERLHYLLANSWYIDGRGGRLPGPAEVGVFQRLLALDKEGKPLADALPAPAEASRAAAIVVPTPAALDELRRCLDDRRLAEADILTTTLLLHAARRSEMGWLDVRGARQIPVDVLAGVDELWADASSGEHGFTAQRSRYRVKACRHADFLDLAMAVGWRESLEELVPQYSEFHARSSGRPGFFPTLRNPQNEPYLDWYEHWWLTCVSVHTRPDTDMGAR